MITNFVFNDGFCFNRNPLDGWSYLTTDAWYEDYRLINALFDADYEKVKQTIGDNSRLKVYELCALFAEQPELCNIIINHYNINVETSTFHSFFNFLINSVDVQMNDIADCVYLKHDQTPFDYLPFKRLLEEYEHIIAGEDNRCQLLKPKDNSYWLVAV